MNNQNSAYIEWAIHDCNLSSDSGCATCEQYFDYCHEKELSKAQVLWKSALITKHEKKRDSA